MENNLLQITETEEQEIDILALMTFYLRKLKYVAFATLAGLVAFAVYVSLFTVSIYEATAQLYVVNSKDNVLNLSDLQIGSYLASDYQLVFKTWEVNQQVIENMQLPYTVDQLTGMVSVTNPSGTRALFITVESPDPMEAADIANEFANVAANYISDTMLTDKPTILSTALRPLKPSRPSKVKTTLLGGLIGFLISSAAVVVVFLMDNKVKNANDILRDTGAMPLCVVPLVKDTRHMKGGAKR